MFGASAVLALVFRFFSIESLGLYIEALRFTECSKTDEAKESLDCRHRKNRICTRSKLIAAVTLGLGGGLEAVAVFLFIAFGHQTGA
jgi:hypothetical protein